MKQIRAEITGIRYKPFLCRTLDTFSISSLQIALASHASFVLNVGDEGSVAISWWVSAKRTRSYPYMRVYDTLAFPGKKVTVIPIFKDEGVEGDRDFLQWDTISLMSLLGVYVIIAFYVDAERSSHYECKITKQRFDSRYLQKTIEDILSYQSDPLHWNIAQVESVGAICQRALESYAILSAKLSVPMHSAASASKRIEELLKGKDNFMKLSRGLAQKAQFREGHTMQPKESLRGQKAILTIKNYLGGYYYFTADEAWVEGNDLYLVEGKHTASSNLPAMGDIKDGLVKMILFSNLQNTEIDTCRYNPIAVLKLTSGKNVALQSLTVKEDEILEGLKQEASYNQFRIILNDTFLV